MIVALWAYWLVGFMQSPLRGKQDLVLCLFHGIRQQLGCFLRHWDQFTWALVEHPCGVPGLVPKMPDLGGLGRDAHHCGQSSRTLCPNHHTPGVGRKTALLGSVLGKVSGLGGGTMANQAGDSSYSI